MPIPRHPSKTRKSPSPSPRSGSPNSRGTRDSRDDLLARARQVRLVAFDVDGVLTDGRVTFSSSGGEMKSFDIKDGHAIKIAQRAGLRIAFITGRESTVVDRRARELGVELVYQGAKDKRQALERLLRDTGMAAAEVAYLGDDLVDLPVLSRVGLGGAVADAVTEVRAAARLVLQAEGGRGAALELVRFILVAQGKWQEVVGRYRE
jgi:3-deoxy-D-manno-octulosonate 8-phosphate phosphatase (KDO 8-P phosphatase)